MTLGKFPDLTVDQAREMADRTLGEVATIRENSNDQRQAEKNTSITLTDVVRQHSTSTRDNFAVSMCNALDVALCEPCR